LGDKITGLFHSNLVEVILQAFHRTSEYPIAGQAADNPNQKTQADLFPVALEEAYVK
jgi:hypothetical protein